MSGKCCFLIGHRDVTSDIYGVLMQAVEKHIVEYSVKEFIVGNHGGFDRLAAQAVHYAVDHAEFMIAYVWHTASNARKILDYAEKRAVSHCLEITVIP